MTIIINVNIIQTSTIIVTIRFVIIGNISNSIVTLTVIISAGFCFAEPVLKDKQLLQQNGEAHL